MTEQSDITRRECGEPSDDGKVCRRLCEPGRDYHAGGHWYADSDLDGNYVRQITASWIVTGDPHKVTLDEVESHDGRERSESGEARPVKPTSMEWQEAWERAQQRADDLQVANERMCETLRRIAGDARPPYPDWYFFGLAEDREAAMKCEARYAIDAGLSIPHNPAITRTASDEDDPS